MNEFEQRAGKRPRIWAFLAFLATAMVAALCSASPVVAAVPQTGATVANVPTSGSCLDKLVLETPDERASVFGSLQLDPGETFSTEVNHWTSEPTGRTWRTGFNSEIRLSHMTPDGFPGQSVKSDGLAADGPWQSDGFSNDGTFSYTNPTNATQTEFVLEIGAWDYPSSGVIGRTEGSAFSTCVSPHSPPERPATSCATMPTLRADSKATVRSDPFYMPANGRLRLDMLDSRTFARTGAGNVSSARHGNWNYHIRLIDAATGERVDDDVLNSAVFYWTREAYLSPNEGSLFNDRTAGDVILELATWFTAGRGQPRTEVANATVNGSSVCLKENCFSGTSLAAPQIFASPDQRPHFDGRTLIAGWEAVTCATDYHYRVTGPGLTEYGATSATSLEYELPAGAADGRYCLRVLAVNGGYRLDSPPSTQCADFTDPCRANNRLASPTIAEEGRAAMAVRTFTIDWDDVDCAGDYHYHITGPDFGHYGATSDSELSYTLPDRAKPGLYCISLVAVNGGFPPDSARTNADRSLSFGCATIGTALATDDEDKDAPGQSVPAIEENPNGGAKPVAARAGGPADICKSESRIDASVVELPDEPAFKAIRFNISGIGPARYQVRHSHHYPNGKKDDWLLKEIPSDNYQGTTYREVRVTELHDYFLFSNSPTRYAYSITAERDVPGKRYSDYDFCLEIDGRKLAATGAPDAEALLQRAAAGAGLTGGVDGNPWFEGQPGRFSTMELRSLNRSERNDLLAWAAGEGEQNILRIAREADDLLRKGNARYDSYLYRMLPLWYIAGEINPEYKRAFDNYERIYGTAAFDPAAVASMGITISAEVAGTALGETKWVGSVQGSAILAGAAAIAGTAFIISEIVAGEFLNSGQDIVEIAGVAWAFTTALAVAAGLGPVGVAIMGIISVFLAVLAAFLPDNQEEKVLLGDRMNVVERKNYHARTRAIESQIDSLEDVVDHLEDKLESGDCETSRYGRCYEASRNMFVVDDPELADDVVIIGDPDAPPSVVSVIHLKRDKESREVFGLEHVLDWPVERYPNTWGWHLRKSLGNAWQSNWSWDKVRRVTSSGYRDDPSPGLHFRDVRPVRDHYKSELSEHLACGVPVDALDVECP